MTGPNYNSNTSGGMLQGLGELLRGLSSLNDPDKQKREQMLQLLQTNPQIRDQYIQQFQSNPDAINAIVGRKPYIGGGGSFNELTNIMKGPLTPQTSAANAEAKNREIIAKAQTPILEQGAKVDAFVNRGVGGVVQPAPTEQTPGVENIPVVKGPGISPDDWKRYEEAMSRGGILNPTERAGQQAQTDREQMLTAATAARIPVENLKNKKETEDLEQHEIDRTEAQRVLARVGSGNLYDMQQAGKVSNAEMQHIMGYEKGYAKYKDDMDASFRQKMINIDQQRIDIEKDNSKRMADQTKNNKDEAGALWLMQRTELAREKGANVAPISMDDARRAVKDPQSILNSTNPADEPLKESLNAYRDLNKRDIAKNVGNIYQRWRAKVKSTPSEEDINDLNNETANAFGGTAFTPTVYGLNVKKNPWYQKDGQLVVPIDGDPEFVKAPVKTTTKTATPPNPQTPSAPSVETQKDIFESVRKKHPTESADQIVARMNKGEK